MSAPGRDTPAAHCGDVTAAPEGCDTGFADRLRDSTRALHARAERSGFVAELLSRRAGLYGYALMLRNLLPAYTRLELGLRCKRDQPGVCRVAEPALYRSTAIISDLEDLYGSRWSRSLPVLPAARRYESAVEAAAAGDGCRLIAHAYTRYLGDLNGGRVLRKLLVQSLGLAPSSLSFYEYPAITRLNVFRASYRDAIDRAGAEIADREQVVDEALLAFSLNIALSESVQEAVDER